MTQKRTMLVATCGQGIMRSSDEGRSWSRLPIYQDIEYDDIVRSLRPHPTKQNVVYAGFQCGLAITEDAGESWHRLPSFLDNYAVWKVVVDPQDPAIIYVGTGAPTRAIAARSTDGGRTFERLPLAFPERCAGVSKPRLLALAVDPTEPNNVWAGAEEGGLFHSANRGESWRRVDTALTGQAPMHSDIHDIQVVPALGAAPKRIIVSTSYALHVSEDGGASWAKTPTQERFGYRYSRNVALVPDGKGTLLYACADGTPGTNGFVWRSEDGTASWGSVDLGVMPKTCPWAFAVNAAEPGRILVGTKFGELFESTDGGRSFTKQWREFSEICDLAWLAA